MEISELGSEFFDFLYLSLTLAALLPLLGRHAPRAMPGGRAFADRSHRAFSWYLMELLLAARCHAWGISPPRSIADLESSRRLPHFRLHFLVPIAALSPSSGAPIGHFLVLSGRC